jgi:hypothetical protein
MSMDMAQPQQRYTVLAPVSLEENTWEQGAVIMC